MKGKNLQAKTLHLTSLSFRFEGEIMSFTDKQKLKKSSAPLNELYKEMLKELLEVEKKGHN